MLELTPFIVNSNNSPHFYLLLNHALESTQSVIWLLDTELFHNTDESVTVKDNFVYIPLQFCQMAKKKANTLACWKLLNYLLKGSTICYSYKQFKNKPNTFHHNGN